MFGKVISFIIVFALCVVNFIILTLPISLLLAPLFVFGDRDIQFNIITISYFLVFIIITLMLVYLLFDMVFGFTVRMLTKGAEDHKKLDDYEFLKDIFRDVKAKFGNPKVELYVSPSMQPNAYAIGSIRRKVIVITESLMLKFVSKAKTKEDFHRAVTGVVGHEMSHLVNMDYLPTFLLLANEKSTKALSKFIYFFIRIFITIASIIPFFGSIFANLFVTIYSIINSFLFFFHKHIIMNVFEFIKRWVSRGIEYRCDTQSAQAMGKEGMEKCLEFLGGKSYFSLFSTHPNSKKRLANIREVRQKQGLVRPKFMDRLANTVVLMSLLLGFTYCGKKSDLPMLYEEYNKTRAESMHYFQRIKMTVRGLVDKAR